jgi:hypothetical protein
MQAPAANASLAIAPLQPTANLLTLANTPEKAGLLD